MSQPINVAIVGTGFIGPAHLEALRRIPHVEVVALVEVTQELANEKAKQLGIPRAYVFADMLKQDDIDVVHICTPNFLHYSQAKAVMESEKHVICEKPLALTKMKKPSNWEFLERMFLPICSSKMTSM